MLKLGQIEIRRLLEVTGPHALINEAFLEATPDALAPHRHWLEPDALCPVTQRMILPVQAYLLRTRHHWILLDTCVGCDKSNPYDPPWHRRTDPAWLEQLAAARVSPADIDYVFCTHLHTDHIGWNTRLRDGRWVPTFPNAKYIFSKLEYGAAAAAGGEGFAESILPIMEAGQGRLVELDFALDDQVWLEPALGHTEGHVAINLQSDGRRAAMCGDLMHSPVQCRHPEWSPVWDRDQELARVTRRRFLERHCDTDTLVLTAHLPPPSMGRIVAQADAFMFRYVEAE